MGPATTSRRLVSIFLILVALSPSPLAYTIEPPPQKKGFRCCFGITRDKFKKVLLKTSPLINEFAPGPGAYDPDLAFRKRASMYTMRERTPVIENVTSKIVPGPGTYKPMTTIEPKGKFLLSTMRDTVQTKFSPTSSARFQPLSIADFASL